MAITKYKTNVSPCSTYRALLTQMGTQSWTGVGVPLLVGETYTIIDYVVGDDFSNIADIKSGTINQNGCVFVATGKVPNVWGKFNTSYLDFEPGSELQSKGSLFVTELENTLGYPIEWYHRDPYHEQFGIGNYFAYSPVSGTSAFYQENIVLNNAFPAERTVVTLNACPYNGPDQVTYGITPNTGYTYGGDKEDVDSIFFIHVGTLGGPDLDDALNYFSVTIEIYPEIYP